MYRLEKIEKELRDILGIYSPKEAMEVDLKFTVSTHTIVHLIDQLGAYRDGLTDVKDLVGKQG